MLISITTSSDVEAGNARLAVKTSNRKEALRVIANFLDDCERI
jgi:hypothetical protein